MAACRRSVFTTCGGSIAADVWGPAPLCLAIAGGLAGGVRLGVQRHHEPGVQRGDEAHVSAFEFYQLPGLGHQS